MSGEKVSQPENGLRDMYVGSNVHFSPVDGKPLCSYSQKLCKQRRLNGFAFCIRHVLEDPNCDFKQCAYVAKYNGNQCTNPIPAKEERIFCNSHLQVLGLLPKTRKRKHGEPEMSPAGTGPVKVKKLLASGQPLPDCSLQAALAPKSVGTKRSKLLSAELVNNDLSQLLSQPCMTDLQTRLHEEREATGEKDLLPLVSSLTDDEEEASSERHSTTMNRIMRSDLPPMSRTIATEGLTSEGNLTNDISSSPYMDSVADLHQSYAERCRQRLKQCRQDGIKSCRVYRLCHHRAAIDVSVTRGLIAASRNNSYAASVLLVRHKMQKCRKLSRKWNGVRRWKHCAYIQPNNVYCGFDRLPFSRYCASHAAHDVRQVLFNNRVDWNSVSWSETLPAANPPEPLIGRSASNHKLPAKAPGKSPGKAPGRVLANRQGDRSRSLGSENDDDQRIAEEPRRPGRGRGGGRGRGRGRGGGAAAASRLTGATPAGRGKGPVGRPPNASKANGPGAKKKAISAPPPLISSVSGQQKLRLSLKAPPVVAPPAAVAVTSAPLARPPPLPAPVEEPMSDSSSGSSSGSSGSNSDSSSGSGSGSDSESSYGSNDDESPARPAPTARMALPLNGILPGTISNVKADVHSAVLAGVAGVDPVLPSYYQDQGLVWSPSKMPSSGIMADSQTVKSPFTSPPYPPAYSSPTPAFSTPPTYHPSLALSSPTSGAVDVDLFH